MSKLRRAAQVYKNHGVNGVAKKTKSLANRKKISLKHKLSGAGGLPGGQELNEELGFVANEIFQVSSRDINLSKKSQSKVKLKEIKSATWFIPYFDHLAFGGIQTIFRFINKLSSEGVHNRIVIYDNPSVDVRAMQEQIKFQFPDLNNYQIIVFTDDKIKSIDKLPPSDIAFCTFWVSAYVMLKYNKTQKKYYFIQDYEPMFYAAGPNFALAESTYRFGFSGIVNTPGLLEAVSQRHGLKGISFIPAINHDVYYPPTTKNNRRVKIFFYSRPNNPRNAFSLGIITIKHLIDRYGAKIEIVTAGADWDESLYDLKGKITNLGLLKSIEEVAALYRSCDIGFSYMLNKHPSYQMLEYTASGMATVMNFNEDHQWLYKDNVNCLLAEPSPAAMAEQIGRLIEDPELRQRLVKGGQELMNNTWTRQIDSVWNYIKSN